MRVMIGINSLTESQYPSFNSALHLFYRLGKDNPKLEIALHNPSRTGIDRMRNETIRMAVESQFDYVLFLDDDVVPPTNLLNGLLECKADIAAADVIIRGYPFNHMCFRYTDKKRTHLKAIASYKPAEGAIIDVDAVGFSACLLKTSLLAKLNRPYVLTGLNHTEDVYLCLKAREADPCCSIRVNTTLICGHILWPEVISSLNKVEYKRYMERQDKSMRRLPQATEIEVLRVNPDVTYEQVMRNA
jgi:hypothetical protein